MMSRVVPAISETMDSKKLRAGLRLIRLWLRPTQAWIDLAQYATTLDAVAAVAADLADAEAHISGEEVTAIRRECDRRKTELTESAKAGA